MKVCLINPPVTISGKHFMNEFAPEVPLGLAYIASVLLKGGHKVSIIDCLGEAPNNRIFEGNLCRVGLSLQQVKDRVRMVKPDLVGIGCLFSSRFNNVLKIAKVVKEVDSTIPVVVGGIHPTVMPHEVLANDTIDFAVLGEGEQTILDLVNDKPSKEIDGFGYKDAEGIHVNPKTKYIEDLDSLPFPARHLFSPECFRESRRGILKNKIYSRNIVITSRGCPNNCSFCGVHTQWGCRWRARSPGNVVAELKQFKEAYGITRFSFTDDNLTLNRKRMVELCNLMIREKLDLKWDTPNGVSIITLDRDLLSLMKKSGCYHLNIAIESGDPYILKHVIKKPLNLKKAREIANDCKAIGITTHAFFIIGMIGDNPATLRNSLEFLKSLPLDDFGVSLAKPLPGTELYDDCVKNGYIIPESFSELLTVDFKEDVPYIVTPWLSADEALWWRKQFYTEFQKASFRHLTRHVLQKIRGYVS